MIKGVLFDIDGTLYSHEIAAVPKLNLKLLRKLKEKGLTIGVCTSRFLIEMATFPDCLEEYIDCKIMGTGSITQIKDKYFKVYSIDKNDVRKYINYFECHHLPYAYSRVDGLGFCFGMEDGKKVFKLANGNIEVKKWEESDEISNIYYMNAQSEDDEAIVSINPNACISRWGNCGNICAQYIDKSFGVMKFCEQFGFTSDEVIACGDGDNDIQMLELAKIGIATSAAKEETKKAADYVCDKSIEDGGLYEMFVKLGIIEEDDYKADIAFFDVDGTLFDHSIHGIRESTILALKKLKKVNCKLVLNTARGYDELYNIPSNVLDLFDVVCCLSGGYIKIKDEVLIETIDKEVLSNLLKRMDEYGLTYRLATTDGGGFLNKHDQDKEDLFKRMYEMVPPIKKYEGEKISHILFYSDEKIYEDLKQLCKDEVIVYLKIAGEISPNHMDKATVIKKICDHLHIDVKNSVALGDGHNDITMLEYAGLGIAMGNGRRKLKDVADYVTDDISLEGLYNAFVHFGFIE